MNLSSKDEGYAHVHIIKPEYRSKGIASFLFASVLKLFFSRFGFKKIMFQTGVKNLKINNLLRRKGITPVKTVLIENPDGMAKPGEFYLYEIISQHLGAVTEMESNIGAEEATNGS